MKSGPTGLLAEAARGQDSSWMCPQGPLFLASNRAALRRDSVPRQVLGVLSGAPAYPREAGLCPGVLDFAAGNGKTKSLLRCFYPFHACVLEERILYFIFLLFTSECTYSNPCLHGFLFLKDRITGYTRIRKFPVTPKPCCPWEGCGWSFLHRCRTQCFIFVHCGVFVFFLNVGCFCKPHSERRPPHPLSTLVLL